MRDILWARGLRDESEVESYLRPQLSNIPNPIGQLKDLNKAISILLESRDSKQDVVVFGDYDVDGSTSSALLVTALQDWGWSVSSFIPHRIEDGYGLTLQAAKKLLEQMPSTKLVLTCDCGISSYEGIEFLKDRGLKVIVTDHHEVPEARTKADAIINPKQSDCSYPDKALAGVGVAFLLLIGLRRAIAARDYSLRPLLDLVALGTVCDVATLLGVNRIFARIGLEVMNSSPRPGIKALLQSSGSLGKKISSRDLGFVLGPRINAVGRVGNPSLGYRTLVSTSESEALHFAMELEAYNQRRRDMQEEQTKEALSTIESRQASDEAGIFIHSEAFHLGLVGLIASRLSEKYKKPSCVLTRLDDEHELVNYGSVEQELWKGSLRSVPGFHLAKALMSIADDHPKLLKSFGGHAMAAGVSLNGDRLNDFQDLFQKELKKQQLLSDELSVDFDIDLKPEHLDRIEEVLPLMEPFGEGNPGPRLRLSSFQINRIRIFKEQHLRLEGSASGRIWPVLQFRSPWVRMFESFIGKKGLSVDFVAELVQNDWGGRSNLEWKLIEFLELEHDGQRYISAGRASAEQRPDEIGQSPSLR